ncbi:MAG: MarR family transcriptional regulator [Bacteroidia bacterium]|jgi:DNA-binding MarR family transcriptional regulator|nr:MarR family transcriptional regulator [Bacteroidia bacterium]
MSKLNQNYTALQNEDEPFSITIRKLVKKYDEKVSLELSNLPINKYFYVLFLISNRELISQQCIADCLQIDKAAIKRIVDYLCKSKQVVRRKHPDDKRMYLLSPTTQGKLSAKKIHQSYKNLNNVLFKNVSSKEKEMLEKVLQKMELNLNAL